VVLDRLTHWYHTSREWIKKAIVMDGLYVLNNPWSVQSNEKHTTYCAMMALGMPIPETWMVPPKATSRHPICSRRSRRYAKLFDLGAIGKKLGYPLFMKPYDGGGWRAVSRATTRQALKPAYEESGKTGDAPAGRGAPFDSFVRCIGLGPQTTW
jgi:glutathione synthase/RimK-type ligase-like ATP-grasp enzyme